MSAPRYDTVALIGVGLLGGSLGLALKAAGMTRRVIGAGRRQSTLDKALMVRAIDEGVLSPVEAASVADLVVICTPAALVIPTLDAILPVLRPNAVVTDVASTKGRICAHAHAAFSAPCRFVGSHPMAGSEKSGPEYSLATLYDGCYTFVEALDAHHAPDAHAAVVELWQALGAEVRTIAPDLHDATLARTSHVPHVAAACLARLTEQCPDPRPFVAGGFRDTTRIAAGPAEVWRDICLTNREAVLDALDSFQSEIEIIRTAVADSDGPALEDFFRKGAEARARALEDWS